MTRLVSSTRFSFLSTAPLLSMLAPLSLHDALPICAREASPPVLGLQEVDNGLSLIDTWDVTFAGHDGSEVRAWYNRDRKSTRLNSSHVAISYAVFCLKKKKQYKK